MTPIHKISCKERRQLRKKLAALKDWRSKYWFMEDIDRVHGGGVTDERAHKDFEYLEAQIDMIEKLLKERV